MSTPRYSYLSNQILCVFRMYIVLDENMVVLKEWVKGLPSPLPDALAR